MYKITLLIAVSLLVSCEEKIDSVKALEDEVMAIHDEIMPKMSDIHQSRKRLQIALENGADSIQVFNLLKTLDAADEGMMVWMNEYKQMTEEVKKEIKKAYLEEEKIKILSVKENMLKSISQVETFVDKVPDQK